MASNFTINLTEAQLRNLVEEHCPSELGYENLDKCGEDCECSCTECNKDFLKALGAEE